jgi:hypothetical protein
MMMINVKPGIYLHYKGNTYEVIGTAKHSETLEEMVVYIAQYGNCEMWIRPTKNFVGYVTVDGEKIPRFQRVE